MSPIPPNILITFRKNLDAVRMVDRDLAGKLDIFDWPGDLKFVPALDGTPSAFARELSRSGWFAGSGSPSIREKVLCDHFNPGDGNVILPGCGQGYGIRILLGRIKYCQTIFVWEPKLINLVILFGLWDFSQSISDRRLVFLSQDDLGKNLAEFLTANPEFAVPKNMLAWPWLDTIQISQISQEIERAIATMSPIIAKKVESLQGELNSSCEKIAGRKERVVQVFAMLANWAVNKFAADVAGGMEKMGYRSNCFLIDQPGHTSTICLLKEMIQWLPDTVISVGASRKQWGARVPSNIPFVSVLSLPGVTLGEKILDELKGPDPNEQYVVGDQAECEKLRTRLEMSKISSIEAAVNSDVFFPDEETHEYQILVFSDRYDTDPKIWGISQDSHKTLWAQIGAIVDRNPLAYYDNNVSVLIDQASRMCGVQLNDAQLIESLENLVKNVLVPSRLSEAIAGQLVRAGFKIRLVGSGWDHVEPFSTLSQTFPLLSQEQNRLFHRGDFVLYLDSVTNRRQVVFDSMCAGRLTMVRRLPDDLLERLPGIGQMPVYLESKTDFKKQVQNILANLPKLRERAKQNRSILVENYSLEKQLREILK